MAIRTHSELRSSLSTLVRDTSINAFITDCLNLTLSEIHYAHPWSWLRRKTTFSTVVDQEDYRLDEEVDRIALLRRRSPPVKLKYLPDRLFYRTVPDPEDRGSGVSKWYRQWEETGFTASLAVNDTLQVLSSSSADGSGFSVRIIGHDANGVLLGETLTLNGTTAVTSTNTFQSATLLRVSKSANTTGVITVRRTTGATVLIRLSPLEANPRSKIISLYPFPSAVVTMSLEYYERFHPLVADADVPQLDPQWNWVLYQGALQHLWMYKQSETLSFASKAAFVRGVNTMKQSDGPALSDHVPVLESRYASMPAIVKRYSDSVADAFPSYGAGW